jgi:hypothetical protein
MQDIVFDSKILYFFLVIIVVVMGVQASLLWRIRNVLQALAMNSATILQYVRKNTSIDKKTRPNKKNTKSCRFCKHRLAYINTDKGPGAPEDFYHRCGLRDCTITLNDSCPFFEAEVEADKDTF